MYDLHNSCEQPTGEKTRSTDGRRLTLLKALSTSINVIIIIIIISSSSSSSSSIAIASLALYLHCKYKTTDQAMYLQNEMKFKKVAYTLLFTDT